MKKVFVIFLFMMFCIPLPSLAQTGDAMGCVSVEWKNKAAYPKRFKFLHFRNKCSATITVHWCVENGRSVRMDDSVERMGDNHVDSCTRARRNNNTGSIEIIKAGRLYDPWSTIIDGTIVYSACRGRTYGVRWEWRGNRPTFYCE